MYMKSVNAVAGLEHTIKRSNLFEDVIDLYREGSIVGECPIKIEFLDEIAVDHGGLQTQCRETCFLHSGKNFTALYLKELLFWLLRYTLRLICPCFPLLVVSYHMLTWCVEFFTSGLHCLLWLVCYLALLLIHQEMCFFFGFYHFFRKWPPLRMLSCIRTMEKTFPSSLQEDLMNTLSVFGCRVLPTGCSVWIFNQTCSWYCYDSFRNSS